LPQEFLIKVIFVLKDIAFSIIYNLSVAKARRSHHEGQNDFFHKNEIAKTMPK
jgi:hypothetical protein